VFELITIGGDDTAFSAEKAAGRIRSSACPIDRQPRLATVGRHVRIPTARHLGVDILKNLMVDAKTTSRCTS
jgi:6-phosphofructokinase 1